MVFFHNEYTVTLLGHTLNLHIYSSYAHTHIYTEREERVNKVHYTLLPQATKNLI